MTTKELAKKGETATALALPDGYMDDFPEGYDEADHVLPWFSIVQPNSQPEKKELGKEGTFVSRGGTNYETLRFVLLWANYGRGKMRPYEGPNQEGGMFICKSDDRKSGATNEPEMILTTDLMADWDWKAGEARDIPCQLCPLQGDESNWVKKGCRYTYTLRCWDLEEGRPFAYLVYGAAMSPIRSVIMDRVTPRPTRGGIMRPEKPFWWAEIEMGTQHKTDKGSYYIPVPRVVKELTEEQVVEYVSRAPVVRQASTEQPGEEDGDAPAPADGHPGLGESGN